MVVTTLEQNQATHSEEAIGIKALSQKIKREGGSRISADQIRQAASESGRTTKEVIESLKAEGIEVPRDVAIEAERGLSVGEIAPKLEDLISSEKNNKIGDKTKDQDEKTRVTELFNNLLGKGQYEEIANKFSKDAIVRENKETGSKVTRQGAIAEHILDTTKTDIDITKAVEKTDLRGTDTAEIRQSYADPTREFKLSVNAKADEILAETLRSTEADAIAAIRRTKELNVALESQEQSQSAKKDAVVEDIKNAKETNASLTSDQDKLQVVKKDIVKEKIEQNISKGSHLSQSAKKSSALSELQSTWVQRVSNKESGPKER